MHTWDFLQEFGLQAQLESDEREWGDAWLKVDPNGMDARIVHHIEDYFLKRETVGTPIPWKKVAGYALIAWIREAHPELWIK